MVFLTMPVDPSSADIPHQLEYLRQFKEAVLEDDAIGVIVSHLQDPLEHMERYMSELLSSLASFSQYITGSFLERMRRKSLNGSNIGMLRWLSSGTLTDMDGKMFQLVLTLIRNLLAVDDPSSPLVRAS